jgi:hypothetical protein
MSRRTNADNLGALCRRHHLRTHHTTWQARQLPDATCHWTSHTGQTYRTHPHGHLAPRRD